MKTQPQNNTPTQKANVTDDKNKRGGLFLSVQKIQEIATREQLASDGGGTGRSDTNDNSLNTV
jgi:hypothetical protein